VHLGQAPEWYDVLLGAFKAGVIVVPSRPASLAPDLAFFGGHSGVELVVTRRRYAAELARMDVPVEVLFVEDVTPELAVAPVTHPTHETTFDDIAFVAYTHRESGDPLGVVHSHGHTYSSGQDAHHWLGARPGDLVWCSARLGSARSLWSFLGAFSNGSGVVVHDGTFDPEQTLGFIQRLDVTVLCLTPAEYEALAATPDLHQSQLSVGHAVSTGGELDREVIEAFHAASGLIVHDAYGQSETGVVVANSPASLVDPGSIGMALPGLDVSVVDAGGNEVRAGVEGDLAVRASSPSLFLGYLGEPEATASTYRGPWYVTGDRAVCDEDGRFWLQRYPLERQAYAQTGTDPVVVDDLREVRPLGAPSDTGAWPGRSTTR
jgi:acetyl-CoA synthetase